MMNFSREVLNWNRLILNNRPNVFIDDDEVRYHGWLVSSEEVKKTDVQIRKLKEKLFAY